MERMHWHLPTTNEIAEKTAEYFGLTVDDLQGKKRDRQTVDARYAAMYLFRDLLGSSFKAIGWFFNRDSVSVVHALQITGSRLSNDGGFKNSVEAIRASLSSSN
ncbi:MAG: hypothetical protein FWG10_00945 [Eubacteriaceae bacterium]|nr:hypothetical protein [Eubacteriaceae bacterium]